MKEAGVYHPNDPQNILKLMIFVSWWSAICVALRVCDNAYTRWGANFDVRFSFQISNINAINNADSRTHTNSSRTAVPANECRTRKKNKRVIKCKWKWSNFGFRDNLMFRIFFVLWRIRMNYLCGDIDWLGIYHLLSESPLMHWRIFGRIWCSISKQTPKIIWWNMRAITARIPNVVKVLSLQRGT